MPSELTRYESEDLLTKRRELDSLNEQLAEREIEIATYRAKLGRFERLYLRFVGARYAELDDIDARIAEIRARLEPDDETTGQAETARERAEQTRRETDTAPPTEQEKEKFEPSADLKSLFRKVVLTIHPDLTTDPEARIRRNRLMAEANAAYARGDEEALRRILADWETDPENVPENGANAELLRLERKIAAVRARLEAITGEIRDLESSDLGQLFKQYESAESEKRNLLKELALQVEDTIAARRKELVEWQLREVIL